MYNRPKAPSLAQIFEGFSFLAWRARLEDQGLAPREVLPPPPPTSESLHRLRQHLRELKSLVFQKDEI